MADNARGLHVSPGIYSKETVLEYAVKSLGITTLGVVGETLRGPAFQPMMIENWREFQSMFGGTSTEKFAGSQYPKYELPYIAKSYLKESNQLQVCRVLGLSGYNAGPAWAITAPYSDGKGNNGDMVIAVLRSRGKYEKYRKFDASTGSCECPLDVYDDLVYRVGELNMSGNNICDLPTKYNMDAVRLEEYIPLSSYGSDCEDYINSKENGTFAVSSVNYGRFKITCIDGFSNEGEVPSEKDNDGNIDVRYKEYPVSLNPNDKEYILKVLGTNPSNGDAPLYVESLYDVALKQAIESEYITSINTYLSTYQVFNKAEYCGLEPVYDIMSIQEDALRRKDVSKRFLADNNAKVSNIKCHAYDYLTNKPIVAKAYDELPSAVANGNKYVAKYDENNEKVSFYKLKETKDETTNAITYSYEFFSEMTTSKKSSSYILSKIVEVGQIYTVTQYTDENGKRHYYYRYYDDVEMVESKKIRINTLISKRDKLVNQSSLLGENFVKYLGNNKTETRQTYLATLVKNNADGNYYRLNDASDDIVFVETDMNHYKESYRFASTPWIVSNVKGDYNTIELNRLFRFHTISDGNASNHEVKVSIQNIRPDAGTFDVLVRAFDDYDESPIVLERFSKCTLKPNDNDYIAYKIGSYDGLYETKSKYITVEVNESIITQNSSPCGFLGYPLSMYGGVQVMNGSPMTNSQPKEALVDSTIGNIIAPVIKYNLNYDNEVKNRKQYFGLSTSLGIDVDMFTYKGHAAYNIDPKFLSNGFHLDSRLDMDGYSESERPNITVDGETGYFFDAVSTNNRTAILDSMPIIDKESEMQGSIYEYVDLRKFTVCFYGGFDGWDEYRNYRTNTDEFKMSQYLGEYNEVSGEGYAFNKIQDPQSLGLNQMGITSDFYAYLAGARQFANPEAVDINVFATPGIDIINNKLLAQEVIEMIEEERADSIYVATIPDKPFGAADYVDEMYTPEDIVIELEDTEIDSNYTCVYYPWVKYEDTDNNQYIYLPPTKDVVRNMAMTDNTAQPWFAVAGTSRGNVECTRAHYITKLADEDVLYEGRINPIKTFAQEGVKIWGQKNLQIKENQLNRIAVRRLLLRMRKLIAISCIGLIFEPNDATTKNKFLSVVTPIMDNIKANRGISDYRIEVNDTI